MHLNIRRMYWSSLTYSNQRCVPSCPKCLLAISRLLNLGTRALSLLSNHLWPFPILQKTSLLVNSIN
ncbi:hypothetical protein C0J52_01461 [Blattella germanica]|nr:hypothetical protein C0J52_01461 [Blattella germanica]